jgi:hypothetical protein
MRAPRADGANDGALVMLATGIQEDGKPSCKRSLDHDPLAEIVASFKWL